MKSNPKIYHQIESFQDLQLAKYKLKLALHYSEKRIQGQYEDFKSHLTLENLGKEAGKWVVQKIQPNSSSRQIKSNESQELSKSSKKNQFNELLPYLISGIFQVIQIMLTNSKP